MLSKEVTVNTALFMYYMFCKNYYCIQINIFMFLKYNKDVLVAYSHFLRARNVTLPKWRNDTDDENNIFWRNIEKVQLSKLYFLVYKACIKLDKVYLMWWRKNGWLQATGEYIPTSAQINVNRASAEVTRLERTLETAWHISNSYITFKEAYNGIFMIVYMKRNIGCSVIFLFLVYV